MTPSRSAIAGLRLLPVLVIAMMAGCLLPMKEARKPAPNVPVVVFDSGRGTGPYDQMTYYRYESGLTIVPTADLPVRGIRPQIWYANGTCGFTAIIRDENFQPLAAEAGIVDGTGYATPTFSDRRLDTPVTLQAGQTYIIIMDVWTTKSVGIYTTGDRTGGIVGSAAYTTLYARSDTADHLDRGAIAFQLLE